MADLTLINVASKATADAHYADNANPHGVTKSQVGLSNVDNTSDAGKPVSTAQAIAISLVQTDIDAHEARTDNPHTVTKTQVGLGNVDNTADTAKPVSTAQQTAIDLKVTANAGITGATKTKVTYDSKGLVTSGADATTADIADSSNKRYVTDAQLTVLGNTSGTNSGNETAASIGAIVNGATAYATPLDADKIGIWDVVNSLFKYVTWANIKATLKTYFDTLYLVGDHSVVCNTGNGYGSTGTKIRRFTNSTTVGTAITYADSSTAGASLIINEDGLYAMHYTDLMGSTATIVGLSVNASSLSTNVTSLTPYSNRTSIVNGCRIQEGGAPVNNISCVGATIRLLAGDVVRPHTDGNGSPSTASYVQFGIYKISK